MHRNPTIVSLTQLQDHEAQQQQQQDAPQGAPPCVKHCVGAKLPLYVYDECAQPKLPRAPSWGGSLMVPDVDDAGRYADRPQADALSWLLTHLKQLHAKAAARRVHIAASRPHAAHAQPHAACLARKQPSHALALPRPCHDSDDSEHACWAKPPPEPAFLQKAAVPCMPEAECEDGEPMQLGTITGRSLLDTVLLALWEDCAEQGLFRYDVTACATKVCGAARVGRGGEGCRHGQRQLAACSVGICVHAGAACACVRPGARAAHAPHPAACHALRRWCRACLASSRSSTRGAR